MGTKDLRVWCGASSTGEEPYTLAMIIQDFFGVDHTWDTRLLATDISMKVLSHAAKGVYLKEDIEPLPVKQFNLMDPINFKKKFHIVFLRNVMIYFQDDIKYPLINRIYDHMEPGGYLFIGLTERLERQMVKFNYVQPSIYRK